ncbi:MAG: cell wall hydrolase [Henriciella sp.]|nr:cell wall hydrolase [Henriciella sp.]
MTLSTNHSPVRGSISARFSRWWKADTPTRRMAVIGQGVFGAVCVTAFAVGLPMLASVNADLQDASEMRERTARLAETRDATIALRAEPNISPLLEHDWLRSVEYSLERDTDSALNRYAALERDRAALIGLKSFEPMHMARADDMVRQTQCLAEAVYYEARSESSAGQLGVAEVIMNRVKDHRYPNTICDVVYQGATRTTGCQFTFTCDGAMGKKPRGSRWDKANTVAAHVLMGLNETKTAGATHYHATYVNPVWNSGLVKTRQIGTHIFYRFPRGQEWAQASARQERRLAQRRSGLSTLVPEKLSDAPKAKLIQAAAPAPETNIDLNTAQLNAMMLNKSATTGEPAALPRPEGEATAAPKMVRRVIDGNVVEEPERSVSFDPVIDEVIGAG